MLLRRVSAINLQHILIILLFYCKSSIFNIINTPPMIPNIDPLKIQHHSEPQAHQYNHQHPTALVQPGNARLYAKTGHWSDQQKLRYLIFIDYHHQQLRNRKGRRQGRLFRAMSAFVRTRKPNQCRSHHAKMESYFEDIAAIIGYLRARTPDYRTCYAQALPELQQTALGPNCPAPLGQNQEESLSNNESDCRGAPVIAAKRTRGSRTSIKLAEDEGAPDFSDKNLPKTDNSLNNIPQTNPNINSQKHSSLCWAPGSQVQIDYASSHYFQLPTSGLLSWQELQLEQMGNFFEYYQQRAGSAWELREWIECERLYLLWRNRAAQLANH